METVKRVAARQLSFRDINGNKRAIKPDAPVTVEGIADLGGISKDKASDLLGDLIDDGAVREIIPEGDIVNAKYFDEDEETARQLEATEVAAKENSAREPAAKEAAARENAPRDAATKNKPAR